MYIFHIFIYPSADRHSPPKQNFQAKMVSVVNSINHARKSAQSSKNNTCQRLGKEEKLPNRNRTGNENNRPIPLNTHTHTEMEGPGRLQATAARGAQSCALRSCALRCAHRSHPEPLPRAPARNNRKDAQPPRGAPHRPPNPRSANPPPSPSAAMRSSLRIAAAPRGCGAPGSAHPRGDLERSRYSPAISA